MSATHAPRLDVFYPIVPDVDWLARLVPLGVRTIQLRLKDAPRRRGAPPDRARASSSAARHGCQLIVNDYWREAIEARRRLRPSRPGGSGRRRPRAIKAAGCGSASRTHSDEELETALAAEPDYVALGPDLRDQAQGHEVGAAGPRARSATGSAASARCRSSPSAASRPSARPA